MSNHPKALSEAFALTQKDHDWVVQDRTGVEIARLDGATASVWRLSDGARSIDAIAAALGEACDRDGVFASLDRLCDLGLMQARVTPPAGRGGGSRRGVLKGAAWVGGLIGAAAAMPVAAEVRSKDVASATSANEEARKKRASESKSKSSRDRSAAESGNKRNGVEQEQKQKQKHGVEARRGEEQNKSQAREQGKKHPSVSGPGEEREKSAAREASAKHGN